MTLEKLKELLAAGLITQEQFDDASQRLGLTEPTAQQHNLQPEQNESETEPTSPVDMEAIQRLIQSRVDTAMAQERRKNADLEKKLKNLQQAKLTEDELKLIEMQEKEQAIADRERAIVEKECRLFAVKAVKEAGLDDGSDLALGIVDFVMADDESEITTRVQTFKALFDRAVTAAVDRRIKESGYTPIKSGGLNNGKNPFAKDQFNLTEQMSLLAGNPELAAKLKSEAGLQ